MGQYCSNCGNKRENLEGKFCKKCGHSFELLTSGDQHSQKIKENQSLDDLNNAQESNQNTKKDQLAKERITQSMEGAKKQTKKIQESFQKSEWKSKATKKLDSINNNPEQKKKIIRIGSIVILIVLLVFGWKWVSTKDYRHAMANGDNYFSQGKFDKAMDFYEQAQEEKPGDEKAVQMADYSKELGIYWVQINEDEFKNSRSQVIEQIEQNLDQIKDKQVKEKYKDVVSTIKNSETYQLEERIGNKYKKAYDY